MILSETSIPSKSFSADYRFDNQVGTHREISNRVVIGVIGLELATQLFLTGFTILAPFMLNFEIAM